MFSYGCDLIQITRREWLALSGIALSTACQTKKGTGFPGYALIANAGDETLTAIDLTAFRFVRSIPLGASATQVLPSKLGNFVLTPKNGTVHVVSRELRVVKSRRLSDHLGNMCLSPDGQSLLVTTPDTSGLIVVDANSLAVRSRYKLTNAPFSMSAPPAPMLGEKPKPLYVATATGNERTVELFDMRSGQHWTRVFAGPIGDIRFRADGERLLVANLGERCVTALNTPDLQPIADLPLAMLPENLCFNADQGQLFVSGQGMDAVAIIFPYNPLEVDQTVLAGRDPGVMACSENPAYLFVGSDSGSDVCVLNIDSRKMIGIVDAGKKPTYITVTPDSQYALVLSESAGTMAVIHIPAVAANARNADKWRDKITAGLFTLLPVGDRPVHVAVVPSQAA